MKFKVFVYFLFLIPISSISCANPPKLNEDWTQTFQIQNLILNENSKYQNIIIFNNRTLGNVLMLDEVVQLSDRDEFIYHEMLSHVPMVLHPNPKSILIVGGGDGAILRQILKHKGLQEVTVVEIDGRMVDLCQKHFPHLAQGAFEDSRVRLLIDDGFKYLKKTNSTYDVIIVSTDNQMGPGKSLFKKQFYLQCKQALKENGILACMSSNPILQLDDLISNKKIKKEVFTSTHFYFAPAPSQLTGIKTFSISFTGKGTPTPTRRDLNKRYLQINGELKYYSPEIHLSAFLVPKYLEEALN